MMKRVTYLTRSKGREREAADEKEPVGESDLIHWLPRELKMQILMKLPAKSVATFVFISKLWSSIVRETDLTDRFISQSTSRPGLLFTFRGFMEYRFLSCSQDEPSVVYSRCSWTTPIITNLSSPNRGLICGEQSFSNRIKLICNPSTGQCVNLPRVKTRDKYPYQVLHFLGYDPANNQYKVLCMTVADVYISLGPVISEEHQVFTLGARKKTWRSVECKLPHIPVTRELCKDGVLYYGAQHNDNAYHYDGRSFIVSFDVRSEEFGVIELPDGVIVITEDLSRLVNYHGKIALAVDSLNNEFHLWVLQDICKHEWSKISFVLPDIAGGMITFSCIGTVSNGVTVFQTCTDASPFFLIYYDHESQTKRRVEVEGARCARDGRIVVFMDHVESPMYLEKEVLTR